MTMQNILIAVLVVDVILLIRAEVLKIRRQSYIFKPLATLLVIAICLLSISDPNFNPTYTWGALIGLLFSLGGDVALLFQEQRKPFMIGLALFLTAHIAYTVVFVLLGQPTPWDWLAAAVLLALAVGFYTLIRENLGGMKVPVIAYIVIISVMVSRAFTAFASPAFSAL